MLPPHRIVVLALCVTVAYSLPASPPSDNGNGDGPKSKKPASSLLPWIGGGTVAAALVGLPVLFNRWKSRAGASTPSSVHPSSNGGAGVGNPPPEDPSRAPVEHIPAQLPAGPIERPSPASDGELLEDPYNPHGLVSSSIPGRPPHLPWSAPPPDFHGDSISWTRDQNADYIASKLLTYEGDRLDPIDRWLNCMKDKLGRQWGASDYLKETFSWAEMHVFKAQEDKCIPQVNEEIKTEASLEGKPTYQARTHTAARYNPYGLETPNTPRRLPRPAYENRRAGFAGDRLSYIADENKAEIVAKLMRYGGQTSSSWFLFVICMESRIGSGFKISNYIKEQLTPAQMEEARNDEDSCVRIINAKLDHEARFRHTRAFVPVRTFPPLNPQRQTGQRNGFSLTAPVEALSHRAARFVTTESHRLHLGALARPLQQFIREAPKKMWEAELAH